MNELKNLSEFIKESTTSFTMVNTVEKFLVQNGFACLRADESWKIEAGGSYFIKSHESSMIAFQIGDKAEAGEEIRMVAAHTDSPCLRIKPNPDIQEEGYEKVNIETYGGAILNTWLDRPLGVSGQIALKGEDIWHPKMVTYSSDKPLLTIPNLSVHLNREVNKGIELNKQVDMIPILGLSQNGNFTEFLAKELSVDITDILEYELFTYCTEGPAYLGTEGEFFSAPRLDNTVSVLAAMEGIINCPSDKGIQVIALFDNEEIGSRTRQGAGSKWLSNTLERIYLELGFSRIKFLESIEKSMLLSMDVSHAYHPNQGGKYDPKSHVYLNSGITIKESASQSYATDARGIAIIMQLMKKYGIPFTKYVNRSDLIGGSTLGTITTSFLPVLTVDVGIPLLAMHSARELMGSKDQMYLNQLVKAFFQDK